MSAPCLCPQKMECPDGDNCKFAHHVFEQVRLWRGGVLAISMGAIA